MAFFKYLLLLHQVSKETDDMFTISEAFGLYFGHFFSVETNKQYSSGRGFVIGVG